MIGGKNSWFCNLLPDQCLDQAMGLLNQDLSTDTESLHARLFETISKRLRELRLLLLHQAHSATRANLVRRLRFELRWGLIQRCLRPPRLPIPASSAQKMEGRRGIEPRFRRS